MRIGLVEMKNFGLEFFQDVKAATFLEESAGVADLMTSCMGGRNRKVAEAFARTGKSFDDLEKELLGGQSESAVGYLNDGMPGADIVGTFQNYKEPPLRKRFTTF
jgi:glycerol-3-phosphate dehydrogenase (NAD+)